MMIHNKKIRTFEKKRKMSLTYKLTEKSGVSMLYALLLMFVAMMVSLTILAVSMSSFKTTFEIRQETQRSLTIESAGLLIKDELDGMDCTVTTIKTVTKSGREIPSTDPDYTISPAEDIFADEFKKIIEEIEKKISWDTPCEGSFDISTNNDNLVTVYVKYAVTKDSDKSTDSYEEYPVTFTMTMQDENGKENERMYLSSTITKDTTVKTEDGMWVVIIPVTVTTTTDTYEWTVGNFYGTGAAQ
ncbi:MAG: hypothetical protein Q4D13_02600 [Erysipelotrichaceae bacterium]|nr:hypothetical protein [Erysipelotrichaceae bacterium]